MTEFDGVVPALGQALNKRGYTVLTPVQTAVLAPEVRTADMLVSAQTGSGKTVAFGLAIAPALLAGEDRFPQAGAPLALAVAPTRELALQVRQELQWLYEMTGATVASCVGGMDMRGERNTLQRGAHIVVGTPGRLRDHIERNSLDMSSLRAVVLDEADEMLDLGFREDLEFILGAAPAGRRTLLFSATVPRTIATLAKRYQRDAVRVSTSAEQRQHVDIEYRALTVAPSDRENAIINVLRYYEAKSAIVFCSTRATVNRMTSRFTNRGFSVVALSGELSQSERTHALQAMRDGRARVCIATDVAARGLDLPNLELVIHADLPDNSQSLLHRSGRTGRAGRKGTSVVIVPHSLRKKTERLLHDANIDAHWGKPPSVEEITERDDARLLADPALGEPVTEAERVFVTQILARHGAEQVAAAFVRLHRAGQSAPEDLRDGSKWEPDTQHSASHREERPKRRDDFKDGVWISLSVGHKHTVEARWILPMLCRAGQLTKRDIGAIKIYNAETHVELAPDCVERFFDAIGPARTVEKTISVTRLEGVPEPLNEQRDRMYAKKRPFTGGARGDERTDAAPDRRPDTREAPAAPQDAVSSAPAEKKPYKPKYEKTGDGPAPRGDRPAYARSGDKPAYAKPAGKPAYAKSGDKPAYAKSGDRPRYEKAGDKPGFAKGGDRPRFAKAGDKPGFAKSGDKPRFAKAGDKPGFGKAGDKPRFAKSGDKPGFAKSGDKPRFAKSGDKGNYAKPAGAARGPNKPGSAQRKRQKLRGGE